MALDLEGTLSALMTEGLSLSTAYETASRSLRGSFASELEQSGYALNHAERYVARHAGISPFFSEIPTYETALAHLKRIANAQRSYLDGKETTHETRPVRRSAQGADIVTI